MPYFYIILFLLIVLNAILIGVSMALQNTNRAAPKRKSSLSRPQGTETKIRTIIEPEVANRRVS